MDALVLAVQALLALLGAYQMMFLFFGLKRKRKEIRHPPTKRFAVLVAAHNEEAVIGALVENLMKLDYPKELYDVYVIADNCTDRTADVARRYGATVCERNNPHLRGKGHAIEWMLNQLWRMPRKYDAVVMLDADNLVSRDFLLHMNNDLCEGHKVIQAYLDTKNPFDSWVTAAYAVTYWFCNRLWQLPRTNLGLANFLGGTGMCFDARLLREMGWGATSLVEDLEFTVRCVQRGIRPTFNYEARVYDEKPITFRASARQRLRWMQGHFDVARRYFFPLLWQGLKERDWAKIDTALYTLNVYNVFLAFVFSVVLWTDVLLPGPRHFTSLYEHVPGWALTALTIGIYLQFPFALLLEKVKSWKMYASLLTFPLFLASWWPVTFWAFFTQNNKEWSHTRHTRVLRLEDVGKHAG
ncbi:MAG: glycosyl transferase family 2 [Candidatus Reconcilbacillus cellulovorans]|uniref:Glycosyl transferase family 2 n=1 Tax=Candidatus Reconcilbacillus cellulovorans TaxID=1906605 RepID=A0A2A6DYE6_9BACL|nr:MAG: glycosyl transferase family 2 [Candidatus Reconcilbacillus cellulovorans]